MKKLLFSSEAQLISGAYENKKRVYYVFSEEID